VNFYKHYIIILFLFQANGFMIMFNILCCVLQIMVFAAFSAVSMVVGVVNIQLLKMGLVNHMLDGDTLRKEKYDDMVIIAIGESNCS